MPNTLVLSHSSRAMAMVNQPVLSQELELLLKDKVTIFYSCHNTGDVPSKGPNDQRLKP